MKLKIVFCVPVRNPFNEIHSWFHTTLIWNHITHLILRHRCDGILEYKLFQTELWPQNSEPNQTKDIGGRETMLWIFSFRFSREHCSLTLFLRIFPFFFFFFLSPAWAESSQCTTGFTVIISRICISFYNIVSKLLKTTFYLVFPAIVNVILVMFTFYLCT